MCEKLGILRLLICYAVCFCLLTLSFFSVLSEDNVNLIKAAETSSISSESDFSASQESKTETEEKPQESAKEQTQSVTSSATEVSAAAVKGKIIEKTISPYSAPLSYNKVYMKNSTNLDINIKNLLNSSLGFKIEKNTEPQVLIMHTHTTETFMLSNEDYYTEDFSSRTTDADKNMVKIGEIITQKLNSAGIATLHDTTKHDYPEYTGSYGRSAATVKSYLNKYKSIKIVLDLHRDAISSGESDKVKLTAEINGKKAAQVMLVMGSQSGSITNHENWQENLKLALKLQQTLETKYPTLARPLSLMSKKYNQNLSTGSLLIEFGTDANTLDEASYSAELVADALISLLNTLG